VKGDESVVSIEGGVDERRGPSAFYIFALPKPGEEIGDIQEKIFAEIKGLAKESPTAGEMEKLRNSLSNDAVRGRQSTMYRAQRLAEYTLYDSQPSLFDTEVDQYLSITAQEISAAVARYVDVENRVVLDIIPAAGEEHETEKAASPQPPGEPHQPTSPAPQIPEVPPSEPESPRHTDVAQIKPGNPSEQPKDPAEVPKQTGSGPVLS